MSKYLISVWKHKFHALLLVIGNSVVVSLPYFLEEALFISDTSIIVQSTIDWNNQRNYLQSTPETF